MPREARATAAAHAIRSGSCAGHIGIGHSATQGGGLTRRIETVGIARHLELPNEPVEREVVEHHEPRRRDGEPIDVPVERGVVPELVDAQVVAADRPLVARLHGPDDVGAIPLQEPDPTQAVEHRSVVGRDPGGGRRHAGRRTPACRWSDGGRAAAVADRPDERPARDPAKPRIHPRSRSTTWGHSGTVSRTSRCPLETPAPRRLAVRPQPVERLGDRPRLGLRDESGLGVADELERAPAVGRASRPAARPRTPRS